MSGHGEPREPQDLAASVAIHHPVPTMAVDPATVQVLWANRAARKGLATGFPTSGDVDRSDGLDGLDGLGPPGGRGDGSAGPAHGGPADPSSEGALGLVHPDDLPRLLAAQASMLEVFATAGPQAAAAPATYRLRNAGGGWVYCELIASVPAEGDGTVVIVSAVPVDHHQAIRRAIELVAGGAALATVVDEVLVAFTAAHPLRAGGFSWDASGVRAARSRGIGLDLVWSDHAEDPWQQAIVRREVVTCRIDELRPSIADAARAARCAAVAAAPIEDPASPQPGCLVLWHAYPSFATTLGHTVQGEEQAVLRLALERRHERARLVAAAETDGLTGLVNRRVLVEQLHAALTLGPWVALAFIDLDGFKPINDRFGHEAGDRVLKVVAERLRAAAPDGSIVGRLGGDEFAVVATPYSSSRTSPHSSPPTLDVDADLKTFGARLLEAVGRPVVDPAIGSVRVGASIGVATSFGTGGDADRLLSLADDAMYRAKRAGGHQVAAAPPEPPATS